MTNDVINIINEARVYVKQQQTMPIFSDKYVLDLLDKIEQTYTNMFIQINFQCVISVSIV